MPRRGISRFCFEKLLSHSTEKFRRGAILCFTKWHPKILWKRGRGEGVSYFSVKNFWSKRQKFSYGNPSVRHYFRVSKKFMLQRVYVTFFYQNFFVSRYRKKNLKKIGVSENFGYRKNFLQRWDHDFLSTIFCLTEPKDFVREPFCVSENFWYKKQFMDRRVVGYHVFPSKVFVSQYRKIS